jgi:hypothetical protein
MITADLIAKITRAESALDHGRDWQDVRCPYCLDNHHLAIEGPWFLSGIPQDVDAAAYYQPARNPGLIWLSCDCLLEGWKGDGKQPRTFREFFGESIRTHWYGRRLMELRHAMQRRLTEGYRAGDDGHMHSSEAWEALDRDIPDPPEAVWDDPDDEMPF